MYSMWYILALIIYYAIYPFLYSYINQTDALKISIEEKCKHLFLVSVFLTLLGYVVLRDFGISYMYSTIVNTEQRLPIFLSGLLILAGWKPLYYIYNSWWILSVSLLLAFCVHYIGGYFFYAIFIVYFFLAISILKLFVTLFLKVAFLKKFFEFVGAVSLEWYLLHMTIMPLLKNHSEIGMMDQLLLSVVVTLWGAFIMNFVLKHTYYKLVKI